MTLFSVVDMCPRGKHLESSKNENRHQMEKSVQCELCDAD